jgi:hypothetical protein
MEAREAITASWRASRAGVSVSNARSAAAALAGAPSDAGPVVPVSVPGWYPEDDVRPKQSQSVPLAWPDRGWLLDEAVEA